MACVSAALLFAVLLTDTSTSPSSAVMTPEPASPCPPGWLGFGRRCFAFFPVWSSWSAANSLCSQTQSNLVLLHTPEEIQFLRQLANTNALVWLGGFQARQNDSWFWTDESWAEHSLGRATETTACVEMEAKSGMLHSAPCGELKFYICSTSSSSAGLHHSSSRKPAEPGLLPGVNLFDVVWSKSDLLADEIFYSSSFVQQMASGHVTERCYERFVQQEALYLHRVSSTLQALAGRLQEAGDVRSLLLETVQHYRSRNQSRVRPPPPEWLHLSLQAFHFVVLEEPIYWVVALSARASFRHFLAQKLLHHGVAREPQLGPGTGVKSLYQRWSKDSLQEAAWTHRYRAAIEEHQNQMDVFKAINIFRAHMVGQKRLYVSVVCDREVKREESQVL